MRKTIAFTMAFTLLFATTAFAEIKIGVVSISKVLVASQAGQSANQKLRSLLQPESQRLKQEEQALQKEGEELQRQAAVLSQEAKRDKAREYQRKLYEHSVKMREFQAKAAQEEERIMGPVKEALVEVVQDFGAKNQYDIILTDISGGVIWAAQRIDVTDQLLDALNKKMP